MNVLLPLLLAQGSAHAEVLPAPTPYGLLQVWVTAFDQDEDPLTDPASYGDPEDDVGFKIRRARIGLKGREESVRYGLVFGFGAPFDALQAQGTHDIQLIDAHAGYRPVKGLWLDAGVQRVPVSRDALMSASQLALGDRTIAANWLVPGRETGAVVDYRLGDGFELRARAGVFNGNGSALGDTNAGKLIAARVEGGIGDGNVYQTYGTVDGFTLGVAGDFWMDTGIATDTMAYGGDIIARVAGLAVLAEMHMATITPTATDITVPGVFSETPRTGAMGQVGYTIASFEPAVRYELFDDNGNIDDNGDVSQIMGGVTWHSEGDVVRAGGGYIHRLEDAGVTLPNNSARLWLQLKI